MGDPNHYRFRSEWLLPATPDRVFDAHAHPGQPGERLAVVEAAQLDQSLFTIPRRCPPGAQVDEHALGDRRGALRIGEPACCRVVAVDAKCQRGR